MKRIKNALWYGAITSATLPPSPPSLSSSKHEEEWVGSDKLLKADWESWIVGSAKRRKRWKEEQEGKKRLNSESTPDLERLSGSLSSFSKNEPKGRLTVPSTPISSASSTPKRPGSAVSRSRGTITPSSATAKGKGKERESRGEGGRESSRERSLERTRDWCDAIRGLEGFEGLAWVKSKRDDWDLIDGMSV